MFTPGPAEMDPVSERRVMLVAKRWLGVLLFRANRLIDRAKGRRTMAKAAHFGLFLTSPRRRESFGLISQPIGRK